MSCLKGVQRLYFVIYFTRMYDIWLVFITFDQILKAYFMKILTILNAKNFSLSSLVLDNIGDSNINLELIQFFVKHCLNLKALEITYNSYNYGSYICKPFDTVLSRIGFACWILKWPLFSFRNSQSRSKVVLQNQWNNIESVSVNDVHWNRLIS